MSNRDFDTKEFDTNSEALRYAFEAEGAGYNAVIDIIAVGADDERWIVDVYAEGDACSTCGSSPATHDPSCYEARIDEDTDMRRGK